MNESRHVHSLDGIRGLCCLAVIGHHFGFPGCRAGWIGVEGFFVLSGFLITTLLCREIESNGRLSLRDFWLRRIFRLLPAYWIYATFLTAVLLFGRGSFQPNGHWTIGFYLMSIWAYFVNFAPAGLWTHQLWTAHLWSLSKEEQFYFCWPVLLFAFGSLIVRSLAWAWVLPLLLAVIEWFGGMSGFLPPDFVPLGILVGCGIGMGMHAGRDRNVIRWLTSATARRTWSLACLALLSLLAFRTMRWGDDAMRPWAMRVIVPATVLPFALLIASLWYSPRDGRRSGIDQILSIAPLTYVGMISYGIYLYHMPLIVPVKAATRAVVEKLGLHVHFAEQSVVFLIIVIGLASLSYFFVERPLLLIGKRFRPRTAARPQERQPRIPAMRPADVELVASA